MTLYILKGNIPVEADNVYEWSFSRDHQSMVARDYIDGCLISTVFIGISIIPDKPEGLFETMVFERRGFREIFCDKYDTYTQALDGHRKICMVFLDKAINSHKVMRLTNNLNNIEIEVLFDSLCKLKR